MPPKKTTAPGATAL
jgi:hypothetical protein